MSTTRRISTLFAGTALVAGSILLSPAAAPALNPAQGYDGVCAGADALTGTTVVIDFQELNGNGGQAAPTLTRCSPNPTGSARTGVQAMQDAGIDVTGTNRWGLAFVCRLEGRPSATESLSIPGNPAYKETCGNTPPAAAYWSYWHADGSGNQWDYSQSGAMNRNAIPGGFEGWSFSYNKTASTNPVPRVTPRNPAVGANAAWVNISTNLLNGTTTLGQSVTLTWSSANTTSRTATVSPATGGGDWSGYLPASGSRTVTPTAKGTYTYAINAAGTPQAVATATVTVK